MATTSETQPRPGVPRRRTDGAGLALSALVRETAHALLLVAAGASALYVLAYLPSRLKTDALRTRCDSLKKQKEKLTAEVLAIRAESRSLDEDPWAIERALRRRPLGFLRMGEHVLRIEK